MSKQKANPEKQHGLPEPLFEPVSDVPMKRSFICPQWMKDHIDYVITKLPKFCEEYDTYNEVGGEYLINKGVATVKERGIIKPVIRDNTYRLPATALRNIDHKIKLVEFWRAGGLLGCYEYLSQLPAYIASMREMYPTLWQNGTYIGVKDGTQMLPDEKYMAKLEAAKNKNDLISQQ